MDDKKHCQDCQYYLDRTIEPGDGLCREDIQKEELHYTKWTATKARNVSCERFTRKGELNGRP